MRFLITILLFFYSFGLFAQKKAEDFSYQHSFIIYKSDTIDFIVKSKKGEENKKKPLFIFIQGSLAKPLIKYKDNGSYYPPFPFQEKLFLDQFHLVCIAKPGIPMVLNAKHLSEKGIYTDSKTNFPPQQHINKNHLQYYIERNHEVLKYLSTQSWVDSTKIVVAGHSEGSTIAAKMAVTNPMITHLIYSGGLPYFSRMLSIIVQDRKIETSQNSWVEKDFEYWQKANENPFNLSRAHGWNSYKGTISFSENLNDDLKRLRIPVLISYGTLDPSSPFNDMFRLEAMQENRTNIQFKAYLGREHNYFKLNEAGEVDFEEFGWNKVGKDWLQWINESQEARL